MDVKPRDWWVSTTKFLTYELQFTICNNWININNVFTIYNQLGILPVSFPFYKVTLKYNILCNNGTNLMIIIRVILMMMINF